MGFVEEDSSDSASIDEEFDLFGFPELYYDTLGVGECLEMPLTDPSSFEMPKRKRIRRKRPQAVKPAPLMIKNDIRRSYINMCLNILNSGDFPLMYGFLSTFLVPTAKLSLQCTSPEFEGDRGMEISGLIPVAHHYCTNMTIAADGIFKAKDCKVNYESGLITSSIEFSVTRFFTDVSFVEVVCDTFSKLQNCPHSAGHDDKKLCSEVDLSDDGMVIKRIMHNVDGMVGRMVRRVTPERIVSNSVFRIQCDADKRISGMHIVCA